MPPLIATALVVLVLYGLVRFLTGLIARLGGARHGAYRQLAARVKGRCESRGLVDPPTVSFDHNRSAWRVGLAPVVVGQPTTPRTRVVARFASGLPLRLELQPAARPSPPQPPRGTRPVRLGQPGFDRDFLVQANDPELARGLLESEAVRRCLDELRRLAPPAGMLLSINPERLLVQVDRNLGLQVALLEAAVRRTMVIHDALLQSVPARLGEGVSIVTVGAAEPDEGPPRCEVCGDPIVIAHVVCTLCQTPCHADCWGFVGGCSTFGCTGKASTPAAARPAVG